MAIVVVLAREETMERQRSRIAWLRDGDRNTEFFQVKARARHRTNRIKVLKDDAGHVFTDQEDLERLACQFRQRVRLGLAGWLGWPAPSHGHCSNEPASSTSLSHKRTSNNTNQPTEQAV